MYSITGLSREHVVDLCAMIRNETMICQRPWPPILGLFRSVTVALAYMRRNRVQAELAETYGVSQPTISRAITGVTPLLEKVLSN
jgi:Helix-turn-helix of DDE superfamily endonuclease